MVKREDYRWLQGEENTAFTVLTLPGETRVEGRIYRMKRHHSGGEINLGSK